MALCHWRGRIHRPQLLAHEGWSEWWNTTTMAAGVDGVVPWVVVDYPVIHVAGWYSIFSTTQFETYEGFLVSSGRARGLERGRARTRGGGGANRREGAQSDAQGARGSESDTIVVFVRWRTPFPPILLRQGAGRAPQYLIVDPGGHCGGAIEWPNATWGLDVANAFSLQLFAEALGNPLPSFADAADALAVAAATRALADTPVLLYMLGPGTPLSLGNFWVGLPALPATTPMRFYLSPNQTLTSYGLPELYNVTYRSDPSDPVPTLGGNNLMIEPCGPQDQGLLEVEHAASMAVFTSAPTREAPSSCAGSSRRKSPSSPMP